MGRFNMVLPDELLEQARTIALKRKKTLSKIVRGLLEEFVKESPEKERIEKMEREIQQLKKILEN